MPLGLHDATIGIVTALPKELAAVRLVFSPNVRVAGPSGNVYHICSIPCIEGERVVAIALLRTMGNICAAVQATQLLSDCPNISDLMMVGIAGAIPCPTDASRHVRLGDIVVSGMSGVFQFDIGKEESGKQFQHRNWPSRPSARLLGALTSLQADAELESFPWEIHIERIAKERKDWSRPNISADILDDGNGPVAHPLDPGRRTDVPRLFVGTIASSNILLKDAKKRGSDCCCG